MHPVSVSTSQNRTGGSTPNDQTFTCVVNRVQLIEPRASAGDDGWCYRICFIERVSRDEATVETDQRHYPDRDFVEIPPYGGDVSRIGRILYYVGTFPIYSGRYENSKRRAAAISHLCIERIVAPTHTLVDELSSYVSFIRSNY